MGTSQILLFLAALVAAISTGEAKIEENSSFKCFSNVLFTLWNDDTTL